MFIKIKRRKLRYDTAIDVMLLSSYRESGSAKPKHRFIKQWTIRKSDWTDPTRLRWLFEDIEEYLTELVPEDDKRREFLIQLRQNVVSKLAEQG